MRLSCNEKNSVVLLNVAYQVNNSKLKNAEKNMKKKKLVDFKNTCAEKNELRKKVLHNFILLFLFLFIFSKMKTFALFFKLNIRLHNEKCQLEKSVEQFYKNFSIMHLQ